MKARPFKQSTQSAFPPMVSNPEVEEALLLFMENVRKKSGDVTSLASTGAAGFFGSAVMPVMERPRH